MVAIFVFGDHHQRATLEIALVLVNIDLPAMRLRHGAKADPISGTGVPSRRPDPGRLP